LFKKSRPLWKNSEKSRNFPQRAVESALRLCEMHKKYVENDFIPDGFEKICGFWKKNLTPLQESVIIEQVRHVHFF